MPKKIVGSKNRQKHNNPNFIQKNYQHIQQNNQQNNQRIYQNPNQHEIVIDFCTIL